MMQRILLIFIIFSYNILAQHDVQRLQKRFNAYLNFNGSLNQLVFISDSVVKLYSTQANRMAGRADIAIYPGEVGLLLELIKNLPPDSMEKVYKAKGNRPWNAQQQIQFSGIGKDRNLSGNPGKLSGLRIAIDPGHIAHDMPTARIEQKYLSFTKEKFSDLKLDSLTIAEGILTYQTAMVLKKQLENDGAEVFVTRPTIEINATGYSFADWKIKRKKIVLDSLLGAGVLTASKFQKLMRANDHTLFWEFYRDYDLGYRIKRVNAFKPDATLIIHFNVDEKNTDWIKPTDKNYCMAFIPGAMTGDNFQRTGAKIQFLRLLFSDEIEQSEKLSAFTVQEFSSELKIPIAKKKSATYLDESCNASPSAGVFCRNLALCRGIQSPLVYGECLYQDNIEECYSLCNAGKSLDGMQISERVWQVAQCYYRSLLRYFNKN